MIFLPQQILHHSNKQHAAVCNRHRPTKVYKYEWVTYELLEWVCITVQPIAACDETLFIGQPCSFLTFCIFKMCLCLCLGWNPLYLFHIVWSANLMPYLCCLHPARTSFFNVPCDLSAFERGKQPPVSCQTHTHPTCCWKQIHDWRRRRHEFMSTIDSCRWDLLYVFPLKAQAHLKIYFSVFKQRSVGHTQCMERYASISSKTPSFIIYHTTAHQKYWDT